MRQTATAQAQPQEQLTGVQPLPGGQGYLDFQRQEWKCPGCGMVNSMEVYTCPGCGVSALDILERLNKPQGKLSRKRAGRPIGLKAGFKFVIGAAWLVALIVTAYLLLALSPVIIYLAPAFLVLTVLVCIMYPSKRKKKAAAKDLQEKLSQGLIELAALIEEQAGL